MNNKSNGLSPFLPRKLAQFRLPRCAASLWGAVAITAHFSLAANAASITWTNTGGGNWSSALNWSPQQIPTSADDVTLTTGSYTLIVDIPASAASLTINGGTPTLAGAGPVTVGGSLTWGAGTISTTVSCNGGTVNDPEGLDGGQLINFGTLAWIPYPYTGAGSVISNAATGVINLTLNGRPFSANRYGGASTFYNAGQLLASGSGVCSMGDLFINTGSVTVSGGTLEAAEGGTNFGTMTAAASGTVGVAGGTFYFTAASILSGIGGFIVSGGTANVLCPLNTSGDLTVSGGTANFTENISAAGIWTFSGGVANLGASCSVTGQTINLAGANANFTGPGPWSPSALNLSGGTLAGPSPITVSGPINWSGGTITTTVSCNGGTVNNPESLDGGQLINFGTLAWIPYPYTGNGSLISNASSGTMNIALNDRRPITANQGGASAFCNAGIINVSGASTGAIGDAFTNSGTINLQSGTLGAAAGCYLTPNSVIAFTITGKTNYSSLAVAGTASLAGVVQASYSGYSPAVGDSYAVVTHVATTTGLFNAFILPPIAVWQVSYAPTAFSLDVIGLSHLAVTLTPESGQNVPFSFLMLGPQGSNYTIEASFDLRSWTPLTNFTGAYSSFTFTDPTNFPARFYRAVLHQ
jgi:hypothetical protein